MTVVVVVLPGDDVALDVTPPLPSPSLPSPHSGVVAHNPELAANATVMLRKALRSSYASTRTNPRAGGGRLGGHDTPHFAAAAYTLAEVLFRYGPNYQGEGPVPNAAAIEEARRVLARTVYSMDLDGPITPPGCAVPSVGAEFGRNEGEGEGEGEGGGEGEGEGSTEVLRLVAVGTLLRAEVQALGASAKQHGMNMDVSCAYATSRTPPATISQTPSHSSSPHTTSTTAAGRRPPMARARVEDVLSPRLSAQAAPPAVVNNSTDATARAPPRRHVRRRLQSFLAVVGGRADEQRAGCGGGGRLRAVDVGALR